ncbi:MAG: hypothetical protein WDN30_13805 [Pararobbsia sp.]
MSYRPDEVNDAQGEHRPQRRLRYVRHVFRGEGRAIRFVLHAATRPRVGREGRMIGGIRLCGLGCRRRESRAVAQPPVTLLGVRRLSEDDVRSLGTESPSAVRRELPVPGRFAAGSRVARSHSVGASSIGLPDAGAEASERALRASNAVAPALLALNARRLGLARDHYRAVFAGSAELLERGFVAQTMRPLATWLEALTGLDEDRFELCGECAKVLLPIVELLAGRNSHESAHGGQNGTSAPAATPTGLAARAYAIGALDWLLPVLSDLHAVLANHGQGGVRTGGNPCAHRAGVGFARPCRNRFTPRARRLPCMILAGVCCCERPRRRVRARSTPIRPVRCPRCVPFHAWRNVRAT